MVRESFHSPFFHRTPWLGQESLDHRGVKRREPGHQLDLFDLSRPEQFRRN